MWQMNFKNRITDSKLNGIYPFAATVLPMDVLSGQNTAQNTRAWI
jgi:hypothetical protein